MVVVNRGIILLVNLSGTNDKREEPTDKLGHKKTMTTINPKLIRNENLTDPKTVVDGSEVSMTSPDGSESELRFIFDEDKFNSALTLFAESVHKPDPKLRNCAHNQNCYHELMYIREYILEHINSLRH